MGSNQGKSRYLYEAILCNKNDTKIFQGSREKYSQSMTMWSPVGGGKKTDKESGGFGVTVLMVHYYLSFQVRTLFHIPVKLRCVCHV